MTFILLQITDASLQRFPNMSISKEVDGGRRIRVQSSTNQNLNTLLHMVTDSAVVKNPLSLYGDLVVERAELNEFHE